MQVRKEQTVTYNDREEIYDDMTKMLFAEIQTDVPRGWITWMTDCFEKKIKKSKMWCCFQPLVSTLLHCTDLFHEALAKTFYMTCFNFVPDRRSLPQTAGQCTDCQEDFTTKWKHLELKNKFTWLTALLTKSEPSCDMGPPKKEVVGCFTANKHLNLVPLRILFPFLSVFLEA